MSIINSIKKSLNHPFIYSSAMKILGSDLTSTIIIDEYIKPESRDKILDIGCGPANILDFLPEDIVYTGLDYNEKYIESAKERYGPRGYFILGDASEERFTNIEEKFDIVIAKGLIHHLSTDEAVNMLTNGYECLKKDGRLITLDNVYDDSLSIINKIALKLDRGEYIRNQQDYESLFKKFSNFECKVVKSPLRIPYYYIICTLKK